MTYRIDHLVSRVGKAKAQNSKMFAVWVDHELAEKIRSLSDEGGISMSALIRLALRWAFSEMDE